MTRQMVREKVGFKSENNFDLIEIRQAQIELSLKRFLNNI